MKLEIISPEKVFFSGVVEQVNLPGELGGFSVLENHAPLVSTLVAGNITYQVQGLDRVLPVLGGVVEVRDNQIVVCLK